MKEDRLSSPFSPGGLTSFFVTLNALARKHVVTNNHSLTRVESRTISCRNARQQKTIDQTIVGKECPNAMQLLSSIESEHN